MMFFGLIGVSLISFGSIIGGLVVYKRNNKSELDGAEAWKGVSDRFQEMINSYFGMKPTPYKLHLVKKMRKQN